MTKPKLSDLVAGGNAVPVNLPCETKQHDTLQQPVHVGVCSTHAALRTGTSPALATVWCRFADLAIGQEFIVLASRQLSIVRGVFASSFMTFRCAKHAQGAIWLRQKNAPCSIWIFRSPAFLLEQGVSSMPPKDNNYNTRMSLIYRIDKLRLLDRLPLALHPQMDPGTSEQTPVQTAGASVTSSVTITQQQDQISAPTLTLRLQKPAIRQRGARRIQWTEETVDNEHAGKKKSKSECPARSLLWCCVTQPHITVRSPPETHN